MTFRVGLTRDFLNPEGELAFGDIGLDLFDGTPGVSWEFLAEDTPVLRADQVRDYDALLVLAPRVEAAALAEARRLCVLARFGVGYDSVDVEACTRAGVAVTITPDGVRRPMATVVLTMLLALAHKLVIKDRLIRAGQWAKRLQHMGTGLTGRTLGVIGFGNIGREVFRLARPLEMKHLAHDPYATPSQAEPLGVQLVGLEELLRQSDFVAICCALTPETRGLITAGRLAWMKPTAYLINVARGPIVDQAALVGALRGGEIAGAGLDVFEREPIDPANPLLAMENVVVTPHSLCWTDECFRLIGQSACRGILEAAAGRIPHHVVNREVLSRPEFLAKLARPG